jgi:hypothetical protein
MAGKCPWKLRVQRTALFPVGVSGAPIRGARDKVADLEAFDCNQGFRSWANISVGGHDREVLRDGTIWPENSASFGICSLFSCDVPSMPSTLRVLAKKERADSTEFNGVPVEYLTMQIAGLGLSSVADHRFAPTCDEERIREWNQASNSVCLAGRTAPRVHKCRQQRRGAVALTGT